QREVLRHTHHRVINGAIAVWVILAKHLTDDTRAFLIRAVGTDAHVVHRKQDAAVDGLQSVARIGQRAGHDHAHGVIEIAAAHLLIDIDWANLSNRVHRIPPRQLGSVATAANGWRAAAKGALLSI